MYKLYRITRKDVIYMPRNDVMCYTLHYNNNLEKIYYSCLTILNLEKILKLNNNKKKPIDPEQKN